MHLRTSCVLLCSLSLVLFIFAKVPPAQLQIAATTVSRIAIREVDGVAEFYDTGSGQTFVPRGVNYVDFYRTERGNYEDRPLGTATYDPERVRSAFSTLADYGYNTVRIFFDTCGFGPTCIGNPTGAGLNPAYLDNMVDLMRIAAEEGIYVLWTANSVPEAGGYWPYFDDQFSRTEHFGFASAENADWLHPLGVEIKQRFWRDLMAGLAERDAPFEVVLGWQLTNEFWLFGNAPPMSLTEGIVTTANGQRYDMADADQKRQMVIDGILYFIDAVTPIIREYDPDSLITMGFFAPKFPNETFIGGDWYVDTAPLLETASLDFFDFHAYADTDLTVRQQAENFGMIGYEAKPILMGETGSGKEIVTSVQAGLATGLAWIADSCAVGFDGWLNWGYYPWPDDLPGAPWTFLDEGGVLLEGMAPINQPDPCVMPELAVRNVALGQPVTASRQLADEPPSRAVDGGPSTWNAGDYPPQWIEIDLAEPVTVGEVTLIVEQWPAGESRHQVWARLADGALLLLTEFDQYTEGGTQLRFQLPTPLNNVRAIRVLSLESPGWAAWREIEVLSALPAAEDACYVTASGSINLREQPGTTYAVAGTLSPGQGALVIERATGEDGFGWWQLSSGAWAREDVVQASCAA